MMWVKGLKNVRVQKVRLNYCKIHEMAWVGPHRPSPWDLRAVHISASAMSVPLDDSCPFPNFCISGGV